MEQERCVVCDEPVDDTNSSICGGCGQRFHLNQRDDRSGKDCGDVWINERFLALEFACHTCLRAAESAPTVQPSAPARRSPPFRARRRYRRRE